MGLTVFVMLVDEVDTVKFCDALTENDDDEGVGKLCPEDWDIFTEGMGTTDKDLTVVAGDTVVGKPTPNALDVESEKTVVCEIPLVVCSGKDLT